MGKEKKQKAEVPPPPPPKRTVQVTGANELHVAAVLAGVNLFAASLSSPTSVACYPPKGEALATYLSSAGLKKAPGVMLVENGTVCVGLRACLSALAVPTGSHIINAELQQWLSFVEGTLAPAVVKKLPEKVDAAISTLTARLSSTSSSMLTEAKLGVADIYAACTLLPIAATTPSLSPLSCNPVLTSFLSSVPQTPHFTKGFADAPTFVVDSNEITGVISEVRLIFRDALYAAFPMASALGVKPAVTLTKDSKNGEFQCNNAMELCKKLPKDLGFRAPRDVATKIVECVPKNDVIEKVEVAGPGFINIFLSNAYIVKEMNNAVKSGSAKPTSKMGKVSKDSLTVVDFSSPNIAKDMHVGHLRSTIIGESVCRILEYQGHKTKRVNHVGDWGTQFGMLIQYLKEKFGENPKMEDVDIQDLTGFYKGAKVKFDEDEDFKKVSQTNVVKLQAGDEGCKAIWKVLCDVSRKEFEKVYSRLGVTVEECGESFYNDKIPGTIEELSALGLVVQDGGAKCIFVPGFKIPLMVQKSDGGFGYDSTDMAAISYRLRELKADRIVYITDFTQGDHFSMCFRAARMAGWYNPTSADVVHIGFGVVQGEDGKRFKTRSGETVRLVDLLDESVRRMEESLRERTKEGKGSIAEGDIRSTAEKIGYGAIKYFDLSRNPTSNYIFSYDKMLDTKGNTGVYLMFAYARLKSIIAKAESQHGVKVDATRPEFNMQMTHKNEHRLGFELLKFPDVLSSVTSTLSPSGVCEYLYNLALVATSFVTECKVLGSDEMESRLALCEATAGVMGECFGMLSIDVPDKI